MLTIYGIRQCDSCRKALKWLRAGGHEHRFHDLRVDGLERATLEQWLDSPFSDHLINRRSTSWRALSEAQKASTGEALRTLVLETPTLIKRPVWCRDGQIIALGFRPDEITGLI
jgi:Spx/MgsR family transcriptional regulator